MDFYEILGALITTAATGAVGAVIYLHKQTKINREDVIRLQESATQNTKEHGLLYEKLDLIISESHAARAETLDKIGILRSESTSQHRDLDQKLSALTVKVAEFIGKVEAKLK